MIPVLVVLCVDGKEVRSERKIWERRRLNRWVKARIKPALDSAGSCCCCSSESSLARFELRDSGRRNAPQKFINSDFALQRYFCSSLVTHHTFHHHSSQVSPTSTTNSNNTSKPLKPSKSIKMTGGKSGGKASGAKSTAQS